MGPVKGTKELDFRLPTDEDWTNYYQSFGKFMHECARAEEYLSRSLHDFVVFKQLGLGNSKGLKNQVVMMAVLSGMRFRQLKDTYKRVLNASEVDETRIRKFDDILSHMTTINTLRDLLAHHDAYPQINTAGDFQITNQASAKQISKIQWTTFHPSILLDAADDLSRIPGMINFTLSSDDEQEKLRSLDSWKETLAAFALPWRYKPVSPTQMGR